MVKSYYKRIRELIMRPEMNVLPGQLAYFLILSIFPMLTLIGYIISKITLFTVSTDFLERFLPNNVSNILIPFLTDSHLYGNITLLMILGFILVSNGTHSIIITSDELYGIKYASYFKRRLKALLMILILLFLFFFVIVVLAYGNMIVNYIMNIEFLSKFSDKIYVMFVFIKWPLAFLLLFWILKFLYTFAPDKNISSKYMNKGSLFTTIGWIATTFLYSFYVSGFANYSLFYGSLSGIIAMMIWIYILSFIFVMGIAINAEEYLLDKKNKKG